MWYVYWNKWCEDSNNQTKNIVCVEWYFGTCKLPLICQFQWSYFSAMKKVYFCRKERITRQIVKLMSVTFGDIICQFVKIFHCHQLSVIAFALLGLWGLFCRRYTCVTHPMTMSIDTVFWCRFYAALTSPWWRSWRWRIWYIRRWITTDKPGIILDTGRLWTS